MNILSQYILQNGHNKVDHYFSIYDLILSDFIEKPFRLLEIGVAKGQSMKMWNDCFPFADITGLDIDPQSIKYQSDRVKIVIGDQKDVILLKQLGTFDIIIDDGGHNPDEQIISFESLYPSVNSGGWYVIEDLHCSYSSMLVDRNLTIKLERHRYDNLTTQPLLKELMDCTIIPHISKKYNVSEMICANGIVALSKQ